MANISASIGALGLSIESWSWAFAIASSVSPCPGPPYKAPGGSRPGLLLPTSASTPCSAFVSNQSESRRSGAPSAGSGQPSVEAGTASNHRGEMRRETEQRPFRRLLPGMVGEQEGGCRAALRQ